jgi:hypothetical protein
VLINSTPSPGGNKVALPKAQENRDFFLGPEATSRIQQISFFLKKVIDFLFLAGKVKLLK